jgi:hypothetical protein
VKGQLSRWHCRFAVSRKTLSISLPLRNLFIWSMTLSPQ